MVAGGTDRLIDHVRRAKMRNIFAAQLDEPNPEERGKSFIELHDVTYCAVRITITKIDERVEKQILIHAYTLDGLDFPVDCVVMALNLGHCIPTITVK